MNGVRSRIRLALEEDVVVPVFLITAGYKGRHRSVATATAVGHILVKVTSSWTGRWRRRSRCGGGERGRGRGSQRGCARCGNAAEKRTLIAVLHSRVKQACARSCCHHSMSRSVTHTHSATQCHTVVARACRTHTQCHAPCHTHAHTQCHTYTQRHTHSVSHTHTHGVGSGAKQASHALTVSHARTPPPGCLLYTSPSPRD